MNAPSDALSIQIPSRPGLVRHIARVLEQHEAWDALALLLREQLRVSSKDWLAWLRLQEVLLRSAGTAEADACLGQMVSAAATASDVRKLRRILEQRGEWDMLITLLREQLRQSPKDWLCWLSLHDVLSRSAGAAEADACLGQMVSAAETASDAQKLRRILAKSDMPVASVMLERAGAAAEPSSWRASLRLAAALIGNGETEEARRTAEEAVSARVTQPGTRNHVLDTLLSMGSTELVDAALAVFARDAPRALAGYIVRIGDNNTKEFARARASAVSAPNWHPAMIDLAGAEIAETAGLLVHADTLYAQARAHLDGRDPPADPEPTPSTRMFRNTPLLSMLVAAARCYVGRRGVARIHVGACSAGEEVYSLVLALAEQSMLDSCVVTASDIDNDLLRRARTGVIEARIAAHVPAHLLETYFTRQRDGRYRLAADMLARIGFGWADLSEVDAAAGVHDILIANNMLVHFPIAKARSAIHAMCGRLGQDGLLCIGGACQDDVLDAISSEGLVPVETRAAEIFDGWTLQRHAWYVHPRPYWALPPARTYGAELRLISALFIRNTALAEEIQQ